MKLPWNSSSKNLIQLFQATEKPTVNQMVSLISEFFGKAVSGEVRQMGIDSRDHELLLYRETMTELAALLRNQYHLWENWTRKEVDRRIPDIVTATDWKLRIPGYRYSREETGTLGKQGMAIIRALPESLSVCLKDRKETVRKTLVRKYATKTEDAQAVSERTLRCVITLKRHQGWGKNTIFTWSKDRELNLKYTLVETYLYEQLALYSFVFKEDNRAVFMEDIRYKLKQYLINKLSSHHQRAEIAEEIIQEILISFFDKKAGYAAHPEKFYVDTRLHTYFIKLIKDSRKLRKYQGEVDDNTEDLPFDEQFFSRQGHEVSASEIMEILHQCRLLLDDSCREFFELRYSENFAEPLNYEAMADILDQTPKKVEKLAGKCNETLKTSIIEKSIEKGIVLKKSWTTTKKKDLSAPQEPEN
ncbi:hypothetical protein DYBT9275_04449 [Dyadobacter sp. CECT 9275]|uniref:Uncharacterized protein n=1 Tax=Dyadobacter helix TaxID=2822344 RepID=A0A916JGQ4_9BACT|nr:hypothetical protein [Dyadobacter sp. CECT 9275]CAG5009225.1 hypothetical protein DYBT9275_04449 [Dyadobacter sp. CECT 9275]